MMFFTHLFFSFAIILTFSTINLLGALMLAIGTILPDIDCADSKLGKKFKFIEFLFGHRKLFHSLLGLVLLSLVFYIFTDFILGTQYSLFPENKSIQFNLLFLFFSGYFLHLLLDFLTPQRIRFFYPFDKIFFARRKYNPRRDLFREKNIFQYISIRTGSITEFILFMILFVYVIVMIFYFKKITF